MAVLTFRRREPEGEVYRGADFTKILATLGNGNADRGYAFLLWLHGHVIKARHKHPNFAEGPYEALGILTEEYEKFVHAVEHESESRQLAELGDICAVANRFFNREHMAIYGE